MGNYEEFKKQILTLTQIDLNAYKEKQMRRRIDSLITKNNFHSYTEYVAALRGDKALFDEFVNYLTINVSEFYRNPEQWQVLENELLPELMAKSRTLKIWSAACSTGDEPYSLVMMLSRHMPLTNIRIIATDLDKQVLAKAKEGLYNIKSLKGLPQDLMKKYLTPVNEYSYQISNDVKRCVDFKQHNLLKDPYPTDCDLILCRNVLIYFTEEAKLEVYKKFNTSLKKGGILFIGSTEQILQATSIGYATMKSFFYRKV